MALALASGLPYGRVTGIDISPGMLAQARKKAVSRGFHHVEFLGMDMQQIILPPHFDVVTCAFGLGFCKDMVAQVAQMASVTKAGGRLAVCYALGKCLTPLRDLMLRRLMSYRVPLPPQALNSPGKVP